MADDVEIVTPSARNGVEVVFAPTKDIAEIIDNETKAANLAATAASITDPVERAAFIASLSGAGTNITATISHGQHKAEEYGVEANDEDSVSQEMRQQEALEEQAQEASYDYYRNSRYNYSREGRDYIDAEFNRALSHSPELQGVKKDYDALTTDEKDYAHQVANDNAAQYESMHADTAHYDQKTRDLLEKAAREGLINTADGKEFLTMVEQGKPFEEIQAKHEGMMQHRADQAAPVVADMAKELDPKEFALLSSKYPGHNGKALDERGVIEAWASFSEEQRDGAYKALKANGGDTSKLSCEQQEVIAVSHVMLAVDMARPWQAAIEIAGKDHELARQLGDTSIPVEQRVDLLADYAAKHGFEGSSDEYKAGLRNVVETMESPDAQQKLRAGDYAGASAIFRNSVIDDLGTNYKQVSVSQTLTDLSYQYDNSVQKDVSDLRAYDNALARAAGPAAALTEQELAGVKPAIPTIAATAPEPTAENKPSLAGVAFVPPPGMDLAAIPSLAALGVTGGASVAADNSNSQVVQDMRVASADNGRFA